MRAETAYRHRQFILDDDTRSHILQAARWIIDPEGKPGLMMMGLCGNGKTTLMRAIARLVEFLTEEAFGYSRRKTVKLVTAKEIARICGSNGEDGRQYESLFSDSMLGIDDVGTEPAEVMYYGRLYTPLIDLIGDRYDHQRFTIITTNLTKEEIKDHYGERIYDRLKEIMEIIVFTNNSYRK